MESIRLRLVLKNGGILSDTQKSQGLKKSWLLLQPQQHRLKTIAELSVYIIQMFQLHQSCPHGLLLYLDGFVLPPFESTSILKDKDIICVKKKGHVLSIEGNDGADKVEEMQIVEKQPVDTRVLLLANEEFDKETGGYQSEESDDESEEEDEGNNSKETEHLEGGNAILKKRKAPESEIIQASEHKKQRSEPPRTFENEGHPEQIENSPQGVPSKKNSVTKKEKLSKHENAITIETNAKSAEKTDGNVESTSSVKRNEQLQKTDKDIDDGTQVTESNKKVPSRSARRKRAKRRLLQEMAKIQKYNLDSRAKEVQNWKPAHPKAGKKEEVGKPKGLLHWNQFGQKATPKTWRKNEEENQNSIAPEKPIQNGDIEDEVVPVVIRPGHIRFEPLEEDADQAAQQSQLSVETFRWNGIMSKKKGQKWGIDKGSGSQRKDHRESRGYDTNNKKDAHPIEQVDFDKLPPLPSVPKEGDVIAYRLLELSSLWTPEISSYRVGKVSQYESESCKIMLMPVPEFPIVFEKSNEDESSQQPDNSLYKEDGSLEIDFTSLVDVRVVRYGDSDTGTAQSIPERANGSSLSNENAVLVSPSVNEKQTNTPVPETGDSNHSKSADASTTKNGVNLWDEVSEALNAKKAELSKENGSSRSSWSRRALKGSALGPTMAFLRSEKQDKK